MTHPSLQSVPPSVRRPVAQLAAEAIERAASFGNDYWGLTPYPEGIRVNVGWTEILTALPECIYLVVDGDRARNASLPDGVSLDEGEDSRGYYPSVPGSLRAEIPYEPPTRFERTIHVLHPALMEAVRLAARRRAGRGVKEGHRQEAVEALTSLVGRHLPAPSYASESGRDLSADSSLIEGALRRVLSSEYERNATARRACIEHYGASCFVCGFSFEATFGELGRGFIHVHHLTPMSSIGSEYRVDPIADLRPVCPNCHAMLHCKDPPLTIEALQAHISRSRSRDA
jgi:5-methylcytosine-specific restriction protein A